MAFSTLYSAITRGKWLIDPREVESNQVMINLLLNKESNSAPGKLSDKTPMIVSAVSEKEMKSGNNFSDAPQDSIAIISLHGTMLKYGTMCAYGCTEIADMLTEAANSPKISGAILDIDSGGGAVDAIAPLVDAIKLCQSKGKPVVALCDLCASAAFYTACYCDEIISSNSISAEFGSIGVMLSFPDYTKYYETQGIKMHTVYSTHSNYKNASFEAAKEGKYDAIRQEELDPIALTFQNAVKEKRSEKLDLKIDGIIAGKMFYATEAKKVGLIDSIGTKDFALQRVREIRSDALVNDYINSKS